MSDNTKIEWSNATWSPIIGCTPISEGCKNCYAEKMAYRLRCMAIAKPNFTTLDYYVDTVNDSGKWNGKIFLVKESLNKPFKWKKPRMIFVCSMGDLFHKSVPFEWIEKIFEVIRENPQHTFQILTKRPKIASLFISYLMDKNIWTEDYYLKLHKNIWLGVTVENQKQANNRMPILLDIPASKRFISCEPLLSDIDFPWFDFQESNGTVLNYLDWIIAGPETGPKARTMKIEWLKNLFIQSEVANVPFFDKKNSLGLNLKQFPN